VVVTDGPNARSAYGRSRHSSRLKEQIVTAPATPSTPDFPAGRFTVLNAVQLDLIECPADADVRTVARTMAENTVHCVVVRDLDDGGWGIVSDLDLMAAIRRDLADATAGRLAATDIVIAEPSDSLEHAAQLMAEHQTAHVVVVDPTTGQPVGIVSTLDVARFAAG
jgi:CBS domain-containing protein